MLKNGTSFALYTSTYNLQQNQQIVIQPMFIPDPDAPTEIRIPDVAYIQFGIAQAGQEVATLCTIAPKEEVSVFLN
jgi:hypothetical protein